MTLDSKAAGVYAIAPTPFHEDGAIDFLSIDRMVDFYFEVGCDGLTVLGVLGESNKLDPAEALAVAERVIKRARDRPVIVGVSSPGFAAMRSLARRPPTFSVTSNGTPGTAFFEATTHSFKVSSQSSSE